MELVEMSCKSCGAPIEGKDIDWDLAMARCSHCGAVFALKKSAVPGTMQSSVPRRREPVPMPKGIEVVDTGGGLKIDYRWFKPTYIFMIVFTVFWNGFMIVWHGVSIFSGAWTMSLFGILHTVVGIGLAYYTLAGLLNHTTVWVDMGQLVVKHHPLPWGGNKQFFASNIEQVYSREKVHRSDNGVNYTYEVYAQLHDNREEKLLGRLQKPSQALYIEQALEDHIGIQDRPVRGELSR